MTQELGSMRKLIEELGISLGEKDAEIIRLKMHLGDEKSKQMALNRSGLKSSQQDLLDQTLSTKSHRHNKTSSVDLPPDVSEQQ